MRPLSPVRCALAVTVTLTVVAASADAVAAPDPASTSASPPVVLVAQVADGSSLATVADHADAGAADVQHVLSPLRRIAVEVPAGDVRAQAERLDDLPGVVSVTRAARRYVSAVPNDSLYARYQASYLKAIGVPKAWDVTHGSSAVKIGIVDTGADVTHPDLAGKIVATRNTVTGGTAVPDVVGHGTFVAGAAAASTGNATGIAGAGYDTSLVVAKVDEVAPSEQDGYGITTADEAAGIIWTADQGAKIINISLGALGADPTELAAIRYAQRKGALIVSAAGNSSSTTREYPAAYPGVLAVGATDAAGHRAGFSNHGSWVSLAAPGVNIASTTVRLGSTFWPGPGDYDVGDGTSFSTPLVAGAAALLAARAPTASASQLRSALISTAHGYRGLGLGSGQLDAAAGLRAVGVQGGGSTFYPYRDGYRDTFTPTVLIGRSATLSLRITTVDGRAVRTLTASRSPGRVGVAWNGTNAANRRVAAGTYVFRYVTTDASGHSTTWPAGRVTLANQRLVTRTVTLVRAGKAARITRDARCAKATRSALRGGVRLVNSCVHRGAATRKVVATYSFTVPSATVYSTMAATVRGRSASQPARVSGRLVTASGGTRTASTRTVRSSRTRTYTLGRVAATRYVTTRRGVRVGVVLTDRYSRRGDPSDFDIARVTLRLVYGVLR